MGEPFSNPPSLPQLLSPLTCLNVGISHQSQDIKFETTPPLKIVCLVKFLHKKVMITSLVEMLVTKLLAHDNIYITI